MTLWVGTEAYAALTPQEQFEICAAEHADFVADPLHDHARALEYVQELYALRVEICYGPEGHPELADPVWDIIHHTFIQSAGLGGGITLFADTRSPAQSRLTALFENDRSLGIPGRYLLNKTRRVGGTLEIGQWIRTRTSRQAGQKSLITAHDADSAEMIFDDVYKKTWENDPLKPPAKYSTKKRIEFEGMGSAIHVFVVKGGEGKGAGGGFQRIHWSEFLRYEEIGVDIEDMWTNQLATMPSGVETFAIGESSGRGDGGVAFEWCQEAYRDKTGTDWTRAPEGGWRSVFLASHERWDARKEIDETGTEREELEDSLTTEERHQIEVLKAPLEHIKWRRWYKKTQIKAKSPKQRDALMLQECPIQFLDCFQARGVNEFDGGVIREIILDPLTELQPKWRGELRAGKLYDPREFRFVRRTPMPKFHEREDGEILVWVKPIGPEQQAETGAIPHRYCIGVDIAEGGEAGNFSYAHVMDRDTKELVACYHGKAQHAALLKIVRFLSKWFNDALIGNEVNRFKTWTEDLFETDRGQYMYLRRGVREDPDQDFVDAVGWLTTESSKDDICEAHHTALENMPQFYRWITLLEEMKSFKRQRGVKKVRQKDDTVMGSGICLFVDRDMPKYGKGPINTPPGDPHRKKTPLELQMVQWKGQQSKLAAKERARNSRPQKRRRIAP